NCGQDQFGIDFRRVERDFHTARNRQSDLQRLINIRALIPAFERELEALHRSVVIRAYDDYLAGLRRFGKVRFVLQETAQHNNGLLTCVSYRRDHAAEARYAEALPHARHHRERIEGAKTDYERRARIEDYERWLETLPRIEHELVEPHDRIVGGGIF